MASNRLENLARIGQLKQEPARQDELAGLRRSGLSRFADAQRGELSFESRFDLAYNAAHALALYALRRMNYRSDNRRLVFEALPDTTGLSAGHWRVLVEAHGKRNLAEYEGDMDADEQLLADMITATQALIDAFP